ncbi:MAG: hypothetical protein PVG65_04345 [Candidatus Thorarchaeota archaeon]|jgi:hypothetical protein
METRKLMKISLVISLIGILSLLLLSNISPLLITISEIENKILGSRVRIIGNLTTPRELVEDFYSINLKDATGEIRIILNKNFTTNKTVEVTGLLTEYKNKTQIQVEKIIEISAMSICLRKIEKNQGLFSND